MNIFVRNGAIFKHPLIYQVVLFPYLLLYQVILFAEFRFSDFGKYLLWCSNFYLQTEAKKRNRMGSKWDGDYRKWNRSIRAYMGVSTTRYNEVYFLTNIEMTAWLNIFPDVQKLPMQIMHN